MRKIEITDETYALLEKKARPFETPNELIERLAKPRAKRTASTRKLITANMVRHICFMGDRIIQKEMTQAEAAEQINHTLGMNNRSASTWLQNYQNLKSGKSPKSKMKLNDAEVMLTHIRNTDSKNLERAVLAVREWGENMTQKGYAAPHFSRDCETMLKQF